MQAAELASVIWEGPPGGEPGVSAYPLTLAGGLRAQVRLDELVYPDGGQSGSAPTRPSPSRT